MNLCKWSAPGVKEEINDDEQETIFGRSVPKTKAAPAGYTPYVPEGCGLIMNNNEDTGGGGLTWFDSFGDEPQKPKSNTVLFP